MDVTWFQYTCIVGVVGWASGFLTCWGLNSLSATQRRSYVLGAIILGLLTVVVMKSCDPGEVQRLTESSLVWHS